MSQFSKRDFSRFQKRGRLLVQLVNNQTREVNYALYLYLDNTKRRVRKLFFKNTLDITNNAITTVQNVTNTEGFTAKERRGTHCQHHSLPDTAKQSV